MLFRLFNSNRLEGMRYLAAIVTVIVLPLLDFSSAHRGFDSAGSSQWQILTNRNFSSEIRLHPRILLMVTIPWSGEARTLMKQLGRLVADQPEKYGHLKLMVVYKNSQKMIADMLGAAEDITLYYYHQSTSYKYAGRFVAEKILYSLNYFMSLRSEEVPLKPLNTKKELEYFLNSTDKAVLLIELCGWSSQLLHKRIAKKITSALLYSETDEMLRSSFFEEVDERLPFDMKKNQKGLENEGLSSGFENELTNSHLSGEFCWANSSTLEEMEYEAEDINLSCIKEEFKQFKYFFSKFKILARDFFLSPERDRKSVV